ncbi:MAG: RagB/SusD family nutrient uptake outer membrane protein [Kofleriaceae bacterium]
MNTKQAAALAATGVLASLSLSACDLDVSDLNNPRLDELENNPTDVSLGAAATGLLIGNRSNKAAANGYVSQLGIIGREAFDFDSADPRFISELIQGQLNSAGPFGGNFWTLPYGNIQLANIVLHGVDKVANLDDAQKAAIRGFAKTIQALDLLEVINTHDTNGAVIDTDHGTTGALGDIVDKDTVFTEIERLLDDAVADLTAGGDSFPFLMSEGYAGFDDPADFLKFNRGIRARVAAYQTTPDYPKVLSSLADSFIDDSAAADFTTGVYYTYTTKTGDVTNGLINPNIYAHPSIETDVQKKGDLNDLRFTAKVKAKKAGASKGLSSALGFTMYTSPSSPLPLIRNEELILLKAEALFFTGMKAAAIAELNIVRERAGGLDPLTGEPSDATFIDELLYERRYSLLFEGGHRWIDLRRFGRLPSLPIDNPMHTRNLRYPIPLTECNARPNEARCGLGST